jgi:hypothetical protein
VRRHTVAGLSTRYGEKAVKRLNRAARPPSACGLDA